MKPTKYIDITLKCPSPRAANVVARNLHSCFTTIKDFNYAIAMPTRMGENYSFDVIRVFTSSDSAVIRFLQQFNKDNTIIISDIETVPDDYEGDLVQYRYFNVGSPKNDRKPGKPMWNRRKAMATLLHYFVYISGSNGNVFSKHFEVIASHGNLGGFEPNSYGMALSSKPFFLPHFFLT